MGLIVAGAASLETARASKEIVLVATLAAVAAPGVSSSLPSRACSR